MPSKAAVDSRLVATCKMVDRRKDAKARLAARSQQDPDLKDGLGEPWGRANSRPPHLRVVSLSALNKRKLPSSAVIRETFLRAGNFNRDVPLRAPVGRNLPGR